jgi:hypothetical protein
MGMNAAPAVQELAGKLLAYETDENHPAEVRIQAALNAFEKLRLHLSKLVGVSGYQALLARALALAKAEAPWLGAAQVKADGSIDGFTAAASKQELETALSGGTVLLAQLLGLLITLIGETLTLRIVSDVWPDASLHDANQSAEEIPS